MSASGDPVSEFQDAMTRLGIAPKQPIRPDGQLHRFDVEGDRQGSKSGFYTLHLDGRPAGAFGCWKRGIKETWKANGAPLSDFDRARVMREIEADRKKRERAEAKRQKDAAEDATLLWASYKPASADHPYLARKQVQPHGAMIDGQGRLALAMSDAAGAIWSLQTIDKDGAKLFMPGGRKHGCMFAIGEPGDRIVIAEGFATGASIHEATGLRVAVAFDAGNLEPVARAIRAKRPTAQIVIAADDDRETKSPPIENPGLHYARQAAEAAGGFVAMPVFRQPDGRTDFNDLAVAEGAEVVAAAILNAFPEPGPEPNDRPEPEPDTGPVEDDWKARLAAGIAELNERYFVASLGGTVRVVRQVYDAAAKREGLVFSREQDIKLLYAHRHYMTGYTSREVEIWKGLGEAWLSDCRRRTYDRIELITDGDCPPDVFNLWRGFGVEPKAGEWRTIEQHLWSVICGCNQVNYDWLIGWLAYCVQNPGKQAEVAVVLRGLKGAGKGMFGQMLMRIFQNHALHITNSKHLVGNFNFHLADTLFLFLDEAFWAGDKPGEGTLKALITEPTVMIEPKGVNSFQMPNRLKILMASNNDWVVPASADERRFLVLDVTDERKGDAAYFTALVAAIEGDELAAFVDYLLQLDLSGFDHRNPPHTDGLNKQKLIGGDSLQKFWLDCLTAGSITGDDWPLSIARTELHDAYLEHAHDHGDRHPLTSAQLGEQLPKLCPGKKLNTVRPRVGGGPPGPRRYALGHLDAHREAFLAAMKIPPDGYEWPDAEVDL